VLLSAAALRPVLPKNPDEAPWRIEQQRLLKDSSLRDNSTPIPAGCRRRLDEPTPAGGYRIPAGTKSRSPRTTRLVDAADGFALGKTHLIIDRDTKYAEGFRELFESAGVKIVVCPPRVPQCNAYAERFVRSIKEECLSRFVFFSEGHLRKTILIFIDHYRHRRNHQGIENKLIEPPEFLPKTGHIRCQKQLGGVLTYYYREAA